MKRWIIILFAVFITLFVMITLLKNRSPQQSGAIGTERYSISEKEKIREFWQHYRQGTQLRLAGKTHLAAEEYRQALQLNDQHEDALYYLGNMYLELDEFDRAKTAWQRLIQINPSSARAHFQLGDLYLYFEQEKFFNIDAAEAEYLYAMDINKEETAPLLRLGEVALMRGDLTESQSYLEAVIGSNYKNVEAHFLLGFIAWKQGNREKALTLLNKAEKYSLPEKPSTKLVGKGDTKTRNELSLPDSSKHQTLFHAFFQKLSKANKKTSAQQLNDMYEELDVFLEEIRKKI